MYYCFGDSITEGKPGVSYVKYLGKNFHNFGKGGDTVISLTLRLKAFMQNHYIENLIVQVGTNDVLLPFLSSYSPSWGKTVKKIFYTGRIPSKNKNEFEKKFRDLIEFISGKNVIVINIPIIGENKNSELNKKVDEYNDIINNLCKEYSIKLVDFNSWQKSQIIYENKNYFISKNPFKMIMDSIFVRTPKISLLVSKRRDLSVTVDGVHLNAFSAKKLAELIKKNI
jgi:lysophospholipase L1-like esterase